MNWFGIEMVQMKSWNALDNCQFLYKSHGYCVQYSKPFNISAQVWNLHIPSNEKGTGEVEAVLGICLKELMISAKRIWEHLIQPGWKENS